MIKIYIMSNKLVLNNVLSRDVEYHTHAQPYIYSTGGTTNNFSAEDTTTIIQQVLSNGTTFEGDNVTGLNYLESYNITSTNLNSSTVTTNLLNANTISGFTTSMGADVTFIGTGNYKLQWDGDNNIFNIDAAEVNITDSYITLNNDPDVPTLTSDIKDKGFFFRWYNGINYLGFMGFDLSEERFKIFNDTTVDVDGFIQSGDLGDLELNTLYANNLNSDANLNINPGGDVIFTLLPGNDAIFSIDNGCEISYNNVGSTGGVSYTTEYTTYTNDYITMNTDLLTSEITDYMQFDLKNTFGGAALDTLVFDKTNGLTVTNPKTDYKKWYPYNSFEAIMGIWSVVKNGNNYFWSKDKAAETVFLTLDLTESMRETANKGTRVKSIYFYFEIEDDTLTSISLNIYKKTFDPIVESVSSSAVAYTDNGLLTALNIGTYYKSVSITTPEFISDDSLYFLDLGFESKLDTQINFYGCMIYYDHNSL